MLLTWTPADQPAREFVWRSKELLPAEYEAIEDIGRWQSLDEFDAAVLANNRGAFRVALWICLAREDPDLPLQAVQPLPYDLGMRFEPAEELVIAEARLADPTLGDADRATFERIAAERRVELGKAEPPTAPAP